MARQLPVPFLSLQDWPSAAIQAITVSPAQLSSPQAPRLQGREDPNRNTIPRKWD